MGNIFDYTKHPPPNKSLLYINEDEINSLKDVYKKLYGEDGVSSSKESLSTLFARAELLVDVFHKRLYKGGLLLDYKTFEELIINCTRSGKAVLTVWELSRDFADDDNERLKIFFAVIFFMSCPSELSLSSIDETHAGPTNMLSFFHSYLYKFDPMFSQTLSLSDNLQCHELLFEFINNYFPFTAKSIETYISSVCFPKFAEGSVERSASYNPFRTPCLDKKSAIVDDMDLIPLALHSSNLQGIWTRLYSSETDGLSFNRLAYHVRGYEGPTCLLIRPIVKHDGSSSSSTIPNSGDTSRRKGQYVIGAFAVDEWKEINRFHGSSANCLFSLASELRLYRTKYPTNGSYQYLNSSTFGMPHGLGFGGSAIPGSTGASAVPTEAGGFRLFIPESLEECVATGSCLTYEAGKLLFPPAVSESSTSIPRGVDISIAFEIDVLEIWGCGGNSEAIQQALSSQRAHRASTNEAIQKARKVDKAAFFESDFDKEMFLGKTFAHNKDRRGNEGEDYGLVS